MLAVLVTQCVASGQMPGPTVKSYFTNLGQTIVHKGLSALTIEFKCYMLAQDRLWRQLIVAVCNQSGPNTHATGAHDNHKCFTSPLVLLTVTNVLLHRCLSC